MSQQNSAGADLGKDSIKGLLFKLALPAIIAQLINLLYNMVDRMYIGHIKDVGATALTGVGVTMPLILCISAFAALVSMGGAPRASIMLGKGDHKSAEKVLGNCTFMLCMISVVLTLVIQFFGRDLLMIFGASDASIVYAWRYMSIYSLGTIFVQLALGLNAFINAQGFARTGMTSVLIGAICNIILDPIFIFGLNLGVQGAALATIISQCISCIWIVSFLTGKKTTLHIRKENLKPDPAIILPCMALGLSPFIMQFTESVLNISFNTSLLKYGGDTAVGAMTILTSAMQLVMLPLQGLCQGSQPIVGYNFGAGNIDRVKKAFKLLCKCCVIYTTIMWAFFMLVPRIFIGLFTPDETLIAFAVWAIHIYMFSIPFTGIQISCQQTFIALGNAKTSIFLALLRKVILLIPLIFILPHFFANQTMAVFLAEPISDAIAATCTGLMFSRQYHKLNKETI